MEGGVSGIGAPLRAPAWPLAWLPAADLGAMTLDAVLPLPLSDVVSARFSARAGGFGDPALSLGCHAAAPVARARRRCATCCAGTSGSSTIGRACSRGNHCGAACPAPCWVSLFCVGGACWWSSLLRCWRPFFLCRFGCCCGGSEPFSSPPCPPPARLALALCCRVLPSAVSSRLLGACLFGHRLRWWRLRHLPHRAGWGGGHGGRSTYYIAFYLYLPV